MSAARTRFASARRPLFTSLALALAFSTATFAAEHPDLTGLWGSYVAPAGAGATPSSPRASESPLPLLPHAQAKVDEYRLLVATTQEGPGSFCIGRGIPTAIAGDVDFPMEIVQHDDVIVMIFEWMTEVRHIYLPAPPVVPGAPVVARDDRPQRNGYSVGRWEGDTLIVETTQLPESVERERFPHSDRARLVEEYRLTEENGNKVLTVNLTMTDPDWYTEPIRAERRWSPASGPFTPALQCNERRWDRRLEELRAARDARDPTTAIGAEAALGLTRELPPEYVAACAGFENYLGVNPCPPLIPAGPMTILGLFGDGFELMSGSLNAIDGRAIDANGGHWSLWIATNRGARRGLGAGIHIEGDTPSQCRLIELRAQEVEACRVPPYPVGGSYGGHIAYAWQNGAILYHVTLHGYDNEPRLELMMTALIEQETAAR